MDLGPGMLILLGVQLVLSVAAMGAWARVSQEPEPTRIRQAALASAAWFAMFAVAIGFIADFGTSS